MLHCLSPFRPYIFLLYQNNPKRSARPKNLKKTLYATLTVPLVWSKYPNALLFHRLRLYHDSRFNLNFMTLSPILIIYGRRLGKGDRGMDWKKLLGSITESVDEELRLRNAYLVAENRI